MHPTEDVLLRGIAVAYREILETILDAPDHFPRTLMHCVNSLIGSDGLAIFIDSDSPNHDDDTPENVAHFRVAATGGPNETTVRLGQAERSEELVEHLIEQAQEDLEAAMRLRYPDYTELDAHWLHGAGRPDVAVCICRALDPGRETTAFGAQELEAIEFLRPYLISCIRVYAEVTRMRRISFDFFASRCQELTMTYDLTLSETRVLQMIVEGDSNKTICEQLGVSLPTVKTHISHILQKTGCRNRADLIGRHFSSRMIGHQR